MSHTAVGSTLSLLASATSTEETTDSSHPNPGCEPKFDETPSPGANEDPKLTASLKSLREAQEAVRRAQKDAPNAADGSRELPLRLQGLADCMSNYFIRSKSQDEGAYIEALEVAATAEGTASPEDPIRSSALQTQMEICYRLYELFKNVDWLHRGIESGREAAELIHEHWEHWQTPVGPTVYRQHYALACERVASGYTRLYDIDDCEKTIWAAFRWQGKATDNATSTDGMAQNCSRWQIKYERYCEWLRLVVKLMDRLPNKSYESVIELTDRDYPQNLAGPMLERDLFQRAMFFACREWAITQDRRWLDSVIERARKIIVRNLETDDADPILRGKWCRDPDNTQHALRVAAKLFHHFHRLSDEESEYYNHLATIETAIALSEEIRQDYTAEASTLEDLEERVDHLIELPILYARKYKLTNAVVDGWKCNNVHREGGVVGYLLKRLRSHRSNPREELSKPVLFPFPANLTGTNSVTQQNYIVWSEVGKIRLDWTSLRLNFRREKDEPLKPLSVEDWISGRTDDGQWILGGAIKGRDDDMLEYVKNFCEDELTDGDSTRLLLEMSHEGETRVVRKIDQNAGLVDGRM